MPLRRMADTNPSRSLLAAVKISTALKRAALIPMICWKDMRPNAVRIGLYAHGFSKSDACVTVAISTSTDFSSLFNSGSTSNSLPLSHRSACSASARRPFKRVNTTQISMNLNDLSCNH